MQKLAIVILNYNGKVHLSTFLPSVLAHSSGFEIIVADNGSTDDSLDFLRQHFPSIEIIALDNNYGFCEGYNRALKQVEAEYYVLLNSDVEVSPNWIQPILQLMDVHSEIAACQPKIKSYLNKEYFEYAGAAGGLLDGLGYPYCRGRIFDHVEKDEGQYDQSQAIFWASGACMFIRSADYHQMGGLDADFFAHMEEIDLCWRLQKQGRKIYYCAESTVFHLGGGTLAKNNSRKTYLNFRNNLWCLLKNEHTLRLCWLIPSRFVLDFVALVRFLIQGEPKNAWAIGEAHRNFLYRFNTYIKKRSSIEHSLPRRAPLSIVWNYYVLGKRTFKEMEN